MLRAKKSPTSLGASVLDTMSQSIVIFGFTVFLITSAMLVKLAESTTYHSWENANVAPVAQNGENGIHPILKWFIFLLGFCILEQNNYFPSHIAELLGRHLQAPYWQSGLSLCCIVYDSSFRAKIRKVLITDLFVWE